MKSPGPDKFHNIVAALIDQYPDTDSLLDYQSCYQLLIAVILSAQTTDAQVNRVTPKLFELFPGPRELAGAAQEEIELLIRSVGFYRSKAKYIRGAARCLVDSFDSSVPQTMEELLQIPGLGRKGANVVLGHCFGQNAVIVDTHFSRVTGRIGLVTSKDPTIIEREIRSCLSPELQTSFSMAANLHGRYVCFSRKPNCLECLVAKWCDFGKGIDR